MARLIGRGIDMFKVGDLVERINCGYKDMKVGDIGIVTGIIGNGISVKGHTATFVDTNLKLAFTTWKERYQK